MIESLRTLLFVGASLIIGIAVDRPEIALATALALLLLWHQIQAYRLVRWLQSKQRRSPRLPAGLWRRLAQSIHQSIERKRRPKDHYLDAAVDLTRRVRKLSEALPDAVVIVDNALNTVQYFNEAAHRLFRLKTSDLHMPLQPADRHIEGVQSLSDSDGEAVILVRPPDQPNVYLEERRFAFGRDQVLILYRDVTRFQKLETVRQDFIANVSHELRTPLTSILGYLEAATEEASVRHGTVGKILNKMARPTQRMRTLVEDLMLLSNLDSTPNPTMDAMQVLDISLMIQDILVEVEATSGTHHKFVVDADEQLLLIGNEREIGSAFSNLIFNAVRYSPDGGSIHIRWNACQDGGARFEVEDHGIGIAAEHIPRLTERFYRVDVGRSRISGGTGLGLAIVKHALRCHNSELEISSTVNQGTTMSCQFDAGFTESLKTKKRQFDIPEETSGAA